MSRVYGSLFVLLLVATTVRADTTPTGFQEYYLIGHTEQIYDMLEDIRSQEGSTFGTPTGMNVVTTLTATTDIQLVIYDHWEDGYELDPLNPTQTFTLVLGDGVVGNGSADDYSDASLGGDTINIDTVLAWKSRETPGTRQIFHYVPYQRTLPIPSPAVEDDLRFDAPDRIIVVGGPVNLVHSLEPRNRFIGGAMSIYPRQLLSPTATDYLIPIGENLDDDDHFDPFDYVYLQLQSYAPGVTITVDNPVAGAAITFQLDEGATWSSRGMLNHQIDRATLEITIDAGTRVTADGPVTAFLVTGGTGTFQTRFYSLLPEQLYGTDYVLPVYGTDESATRRQNLYVYNPHAAPLAVTAFDTGGTRTLNVPAQGVLAYTQVLATGVPVDSTVRLVAPRHFWGISAMDYGNTTSDWGYGFVPTRLLTSAVGMSWAPGDRFEPSVANGAPVWVSPLANNTIIRVDTDGDPATFEQVDIDGGGGLDAFTAPNGYRVNALQSLRLFDSGSTGAIRTTTRPACVSLAPTALWPHTARTRPSALGAMTCSISVTRSCLRTRASSTRC